MNDGDEPPACPPPEENTSPTGLLVALMATATTVGTAYLINRFRNKSTPSSRSPPTTPAAVSALARQYLSLDPDPTTRAELSQLLHSIATDEALRERLAIALDSANRLKFGTAGMRANIGLGYDSINVLNVVAVAQAVLAVLDSSGGVVIGYDARHGSKKFATAVASVFEQADKSVRLFSKPVPTPFVAYAVLKFGCAAGFCVTASHNPPQDNGLKVFWGDGIQIRPDVAERIELAVKENARPRGNIALVREELSDRVSDCLEEVEASYYMDIAKALCRRAHVNQSAPAVVYTACHGIGTEYVDKLFTMFGLKVPIHVTEQCTPDPDFSTLSFPNPEEMGALDLAIKKAREVGAQLVLANDPDADRLGVAELVDRKVRIFSGNEIATLLADYLSSERNDLSQCAVVASAVSSKVLASMAQKRGFEFAEALTGFKWLNKKAIDLETQGKSVLITYEEALGFNVTGNIVCDKDGVSAAAVFAEMAGMIYARGSTLSQRLDELADEYGVYLSRNGYLRTTDKGATEIFQAARDRGLPTTLGFAKVVSVRDLSKGTDSAEIDGKSKLPQDMRSQFVTFRCSWTKKDECPLIIHLRGSGTEPKIKYYAELKCSRSQANDKSGTKFLAAAVQDAIDKILRPKENGLRS